MLLREMHEFIPAGSCIVLETPVSFEFNPHLVQAIAAFPEVNTLQLMFNGGPVDLVFNGRKTNQTRLTTGDITQIKNSIWEAAMHITGTERDFINSEQFRRGFAGARTGRLPARDPATSADVSHADVRFGDQTRRTPVISTADVIPIKQGELSAPSERLVNAIDGPLITEDMMAKLDAQGNEFDKLVALTKAFNAMPAVVDDDYPEMRHKYDACLRNFIDALRKNGRLDQ